MVEVHTACGLHTDWKYFNLDMISLLAAKKAEGQELSTYGQIRISSVMFCEHIAHLSDVASMTPYPAASPKQRSQQSLTSVLPIKPLADTVGATSAMTMAPSCAR